MAQSQITLVCDGTVGLFLGFPRLPFLTGGQDKRLLDRASHLHCVFFLFLAGIRDRPGDGTVGLDLSSYLDSGAAAEENQGRQYCRECRKSHEQLSAEISYG